MYPKKFSKLVLSRTKSEPWKSLSISKRLSR
jgi:hypothetical protein